MICPFATYRPITVNHGGTMSKVIGLVVHVQQGNGSLYGFFSNPSAQVSAHFWCSKTGVLEQYLDTGVVAWAEVAGNSKYLSCEFEGMDTEAMTAQQIAMGHQLAAWAAGQFAFPMTGPVAHGSPGVTSHCNPNGTPDPAWGNHPCPGTIRLAQIPTLVGPPPIPKENPMAVSAPFPWNGQQHVIQVKGGLLYNKWLQGSTWSSEVVAGAPGSVSGVSDTIADGMPQPEILNGQLLVTVESATNAHVLYFAQSAGASAWGANELP